MKKQTQRILALILAMVMALSMLVYVNATDNETAETAVVETTDEVASDAAVEAVEEVVVDTNADLASVSYSTLNIAAEGVIADDDNITLTAISALDSSGKGTGVNSAYVNASDNSVITCRPYVKIVPKTDGAITFNCAIASGKGVYLVKDTGETAYAEWTGSGNSYSGDVPVVEVLDCSSSSLTAASDSISANVSAGVTYYYAPSGTSPKLTSIVFAAGEEVVETSSETTTEAQPDEDLVDIRTLNRTAPSSASDGAKHTIWVLGDSTACYYGTDSNYQVVRNGYGMAFGKGTQTSTSYDVAGIFDNENISVYNLAISGISSKSFLSQSAYTTLTSNWKSGDYVFIGFGHNDQKSEDTTRFTDASKGAEGWNIDGQFANSIYKNYIVPAVKAGVTPVLVTSIVRRSRTSDTISGSNVHNCSTGDYRQTVIDLAKMFDLPCIDITYNTYSEYIALGKGEVDGSDGYGAYHAQYNDKYLTSKNHVNADGSFKEEQRIDNTHLNAYGAKTVAYFISQDILGNSITYGVNVETPKTVSSPALASDGTADDSLKTFEALSSYLASDITDPRTEGKDDDTETTTEGFEVYLEAGDTGSVVVGDTFEIYLKVKNNEGLNSVDLKLDYDTAAVELVNVEQGEAAVITDSDLAAALAAGKEGSIALAGSVDTAITGDVSLVKITFKLVKYGEGTFDLSGTVNGGTDVSVKGTSVFLDYNQEVDEGLILTPTVSEVDEEGYFTVDYVLSGNGEGYGLNSITLAVCYDPAVYTAVGVGKASEVGAVDAEGNLVEAIIADDVVNGQIALVPEVGYEEYDSAANGPADGVKTAAELGMIRLSGYLKDNDGDGTLDVAYNNGVLFSIKMKLAAEVEDVTTLADSLSTLLPTSGAFGVGDVEANVTVKGAVANEDGNEDEDIGNGLRGDIDQNGIITANDAACLLYWVVTGEQNPDWNVSVYIADVAGEGNIERDAADAAAIMAKVLNGAYQFKEPESKSDDSAASAN